MGTKSLVCILGIAVGIAYLDAYAVTAGDAKSKPTLAETYQAQTNAAVDVVANAAGRDDAAFIGIGRAHAADAEAVAPECTPRR